MLKIRASTDQNGRSSVYEIAVPCGRSAAASTVEPRSLAVSGPSDCESSRFHCERMSASRRQGQWPDRACFESTCHNVSLDQQAAERLSCNLSQADINFSHRPGETETRNALSCR